MYYQNNQQYLVVVPHQSDQFTPEQQNKLNQILSSWQPIDPLEMTIDHSVLIGTKPSIITACSTNICNIFEQCGIDFVARVEPFVRVVSTNHNNFDFMTQNKYKLLPSVADLNTSIVKPSINDIFTVKNLETFNQQQCLGLDEFDLKFYYNLQDKIGRKLNNIELLDLAQSNSEHSRHIFFRSSGLLKKIRSTLNSVTDHNSLVAYRDNSSAISSQCITSGLVRQTKPPYQYNPLFCRRHPALTAETHNFPTAVCPFEGAATGTGGRIRDNLALGRGATTIASLVGYCVGKNSKLYHTAKDIEIDASNGASDYGNKFGEPVIGGFTREYADGETEWVKPIMFTAGIGQVLDCNVNKVSLSKGDYVVRLGGKAFKVGICGGTQSSSNLSTDNVNASQNAVQRGDPEMGNKLAKVIRLLSELDDNPIKSIHDQGAGGMGNVTKEIVEPLGARIYLDRVELGDEMNDLEIWISEHQEQVTVVIEPWNYELVQNICIRENLGCRNIGHITGDGKIQVSSRFDPDKLIIDLPLSLTQDNYINKTYDYTINPTVSRPFNNTALENIELATLTKMVFNTLAVGSKRFLVNKVDRSVGGLIVQQQTVGKHQIPISDYSLVANDMMSRCGIASSIGEQPIKAFSDPAKMARLTLAEALTNLCFVKVSSFNNIKFQGNWMWPLKSPGEAGTIVQAGEALVDALKYLDLAIDGGKDSLSMAAKNSDGELINSPRTLVLTSYVDVPNIYKRLTPDFKHIEQASSILLIDLSINRTLCGSVLDQELNNKLSNDQLEDVDLVDLKNAFCAVQAVIPDLLAGHDRSEGGLMATIFEMAVANGVGVNLDLETEHPVNYLFNEGAGMVLQVSNNKLVKVLEKFKQHEVEVSIIGKVNSDNTNMTIYNNNKLLFTDDLDKLWQQWRESSFNYELMQTTESCVKSEYDNLSIHNNIDFSVPAAITDEFNEAGGLALNGFNSKRGRVAIIRDEGSNGELEMAQAFNFAGFDVFDLMIKDLLDPHSDIRLMDFDGLAFVGGFTFADVTGAAQGWYQIIKNNADVAAQFKDFYNRTDKFSLGICNGCQLMSKLGWVQGDFVRNISNRFESRFVPVKINHNNNVLLKDMQDMIYGIWVANAEGRYVTNNTDETAYCIQYLSQEYPQNPSGSDNMVAGLSSPCGRHLAMMPHCERSFIRYQIPWVNSSADTIKTGLTNSILVSPWFKIFSNARDFVINSRN